MLLVHVAQRHGVGKHLIQVFDTLLAHLRVERDGHVNEMAERLYFVSLLVSNRFGLPADLIDIEDLGHKHSFCKPSFDSRVCATHDWRDSARPLLIWSTHS